MKRNFLFLVTAVLFLTAAFASADGVTFSTAYFTLELPDNWETDMGQYGRTGLLRRRDGGRAALRRRLSGLL